MSANGLPVFDKTIHTTNIWLDEIMADLGPDRQVAWHALTSVLHAVRDQLPVDNAAHLSAQLPMMIRGAYYDQWRPAKVPDRIRHRDDFLTRVKEELGQTRPVNSQDAVATVTKVLSRYLGTGEADKIRKALPDEIRELWATDDQARAKAATKH